MKTVARQLALGFIALAIAGLAVWYWLNRKVEPVFLLELPVACEMGTACMVQHYVDQTPGPDAGDYTCGPLTYDGHKGIDIRVAGLPEMRAGVEVRKSVV